MRFYGRKALARAGRPARCEETAQLEVLERELVARLAREARHRQGVDDLDEPGPHAWPGLFVTRRVSEEFPSVSSLTLRGTIARCS